MADFFITKRIGCVGVWCKNLGKNKKYMCCIFLLALKFVFLLDFIQREDFSGEIMKKIIVFAGFMGMIMIGTANAVQPVVNSTGTAVDFPSDTATHPTFDVSPNDVPTGELNGQPYLVKDSKIKVATTRYVDKNVGEMSTAVEELENQALEQRAVVDENGRKVSQDLDNRLVKPAANCDKTDVNGYSVSACGYIKGTGANGTKQWVKIVGGVASGS